MVRQPDQGAPGGRPDMKARVAVDRIEGPDVFGLVVLGTRILAPDDAVTPGKMLPDPLLGPPPWTDRPARSASVHGDRKSAPDEFVRRPGNSAVRKQGQDRAPGCVARNGHETGKFDQASCWPSYSSSARRHAPPCAFTNRGAFRQAPCMTLRRSLPPTCDQIL